MITNSRPTGAAVEIHGLGHCYADAAVLDGVDLEIRPGQVVALLGPSGCGKSTLLKAVAGLLRPDRGHIRLDGRAVSDKSKHVPPERRDLGMVFQDYALWPHMSVGSNVAFPLKMRRVPRGDIAARVAQALALVGLPGLESRRPAQLSGGQQQRVSLARAIVARPKLLLFDEPLSNLDRSLRDQLSREIGSLLRHLGSTAIYVTHDHGEAHALADTIASMSGGRIAALEGNTPDNCHTTNRNE
jgi:iron(III) transport system ATP-binding protein